MHCSPVDYPWARPTCCPITHHILIDPVSVKLRDSRLDILYFRFLFCLPPFSLYQLYLEPKLPLPAHYWGEPRLSQAFWTQCEILLSAFPDEEAKIAYVLGMLSGKLQLPGENFVNKSPGFFQVMQSVFTLLTTACSQQVCTLWSFLLRIKWLNKRCFGSTTNHPRASRSPPS